MKQVKIFDCENELDLEDQMNYFLSTVETVYDITYQISHFYDSRDQIYSFSAMIIYESTKIVGEKRKK